MTQKARVACLAGPLKGSVFPLVDREVSVGRDLSNRVSIADPLVSRKHSLLLQENGAYKITDLESLNGTFVNGKPVKEHLLRHGDEIGIGNSLFFFLADDATTP